MKSKIYLYVVCISFYLLFLSASAWAASLNLSQTQNQLDFLAVGRPSAIKIKGKVADNIKNPLSGTLSYQEGKLSADATFKMDAWDTGIALRNSHMKEKYLQTDKFPVANLVIPAQPIATSEKAKFKGKLTLHGVTQDLIGEVILNQNNQKLSAQFDFNIQVQDYKIAIPSYLGIKVTQAVQVMVKIQDR